MLEASVSGRTIARVTQSRLRLRVHTERARGLSRLAGRTLDHVGRHGKYLLIELSGGVTLLSHLGMSGRWLYFTGVPPVPMQHVHVRVEFEDRSLLWFQDPRRFGLFRILETAQQALDPALAILGPDPVAEPPTGIGLAAIARGLRVPVKNFLLDQRRIAGIGNIYASEILHRAGVHPGRPAGRVGPDSWERIARETGAVLGEAIARMGTTFSTYRTLWNEPGSYGDQLRVYERAGEACRACSTPIRRITQGQRSTYFCPYCQPARR